MGILPPWQTHKETSLNKFFKSPILHDCTQQQYNPAGDRSFLGVLRHVNLETHS